MTKKILITGGAGFIGSHLARALLDKGHTVRIYDSLVPQVHGPQPLRHLSSDGLSRYYSDEVEFIHGDTRDQEALGEALQGVQVVFHLAAEVGVAQSIYEIVRYVGANVLGTATLLETLSQTRHSVEKLIVASSMSIYGEGAYSCPACGEVYPRLRSAEQLQREEWEMKCPHCDRFVQPLPTGEDKPLFPTSVYAISKMDQEMMCLAVGQAYDIPTVALRYFNVYGPGQALSNPYTGVAAIFSARLLNGNPPLVFEDGRQSRDFIHVSDIVQANLLAMEKTEADYQVFNVGTGRSLTILDMARALAAGMDVDTRPQIVGRFRTGDIRHCYADISKITTTLGYSPQVTFEEGIADLVKWVSEQEATDLVDKARAELEARKLIR